MKTFKSLITALFVLGASFGFSQSVDIAKSTLKWTGEKVTGSHWGYISLKSATLKATDKTIESGTFVIDMTSITCSDLEDKEYNDKLVGHLKSDDFFGVDTYKTSTLKIKSATPFKNGEATVKADLTIKGKTLPIEFVAKKAGNGYTAKLVVNRAKYDIKYGSGSFFDDLGDKMIYDDFVLEVTLVTK